MRTFKLNTFALLTLLVSFSFIKDDSTTHKQEPFEDFRSLDGSTIKAHELDTFLQAQMESLSIPGISFSFVNDGNIVYQSSLGVVNTETMGLVTSQTLFDAASISKTVFSFFTLQMVDKGMIDLDTPLYTYLLNPDIAHDERYKKITARMALSHTTGFPNWRYLTNKGYDPNAKLRIEFEPGTQYQYSGEGFKYLSQVLAHLLKTDLDGLQTIINKELFMALEMGESSFVWNNYLEKNRADGHLNGQPNPGYSSSSKNPNFNAAASLQTNASAYGNFLVALMSGKLLSENTHQQMLSIQAERQATDRRAGVKYGLGVIINPTLEGTNYAHSGDNESATSQFYFNDKFKSGYVYFINAEFKIKDQFDKNLQAFLLD